jgi:hypothetical protein
MENIDLFKKIKKVEISPFLWTRIQSKIHEETVDDLPNSWKWIGSLSFVLLIVGNIYIVKIIEFESKTSIESLVLNLNLELKNQLYDE